MSAPIVVPFNFRPASIDDKNGSHTIPAGKYARVTFLSGDCTYDSKAVYQSRTTSITGLSNTRFANIQVLSPYDYISITRTSGSGTFDIYATRLNHGAATAESNAYQTGITSFGRMAMRLFEAVTFYTTAYTPIVAESEQAYITGNSATSLNVDILIYRVTPTPVQMWVPSGTVLDGNIYHVETFNDIT